MSNRPPIIVTEDTPPDMLAGSMDLTVVLPDGQSLKMSVERSTPMMDLLVQMTTANKMSPGGYIIKPLNERGPLPYKPSTPIGALDAWTIHIVPKQHTQNAAGKKPLKTLNQPFEQTFRLQVHLPRNQLYVARVSPRTRLAEILLQVCSEKNLDPIKYSLRHPSNLDQVLSLSCTLADYKLQEVTLVCNRSHPIQVSTVDIMSLQRETSNPAYRNTMCEGSVSSGSLEGRSLSPVPSDELSASPPPIPPSRPIRKRRPAPKPPTTNQKLLNEERPKNGLQSSTVIYHSRNSSDSSGYHEASVLSESPQSNSVPEPISRSKMASVSEVPVSQPPVPTLTAAQSMTDVRTTEPTLKQATSNNSLSSLTGRKKKTAPPPPASMNRQTSISEDQQRTPSVSSTASSTTTLDGNEVTVAVKSATLPPSSRLNRVTKQQSPPPSPSPTTKVDVEPPITAQAVPAPRPRSKLFIGSEQDSWLSNSDSVHASKSPSPKKATAPQPKPRQRIPSSKSLDSEDGNESIEKSELEEEDKSTKRKSLFMNKRLPNSVFNSHKACIQELAFKFDRRDSEEISSTSMEVQDISGKEAEYSVVTESDSSSSLKKDISCELYDTSKPISEEEHKSQILRNETLVTASDQGSTMVVGSKTEDDLESSDMKMADEEIDRIFENATKNHTVSGFGVEEEQMLSLQSLPSPFSSLTQSDLKQPSQMDDRLDWEYRLPAPPTFRDEAKSPTVTELGTVTLGDFTDLLASATSKEIAKQDDLNITDLQGNNEKEDKIREDNEPPQQVKLKPSDSEVKSKDSDKVDEEIKILPIPRQENTRNNSINCEKSLSNEINGKELVPDHTEKNIINELTFTLNEKSTKFKSSESENTQSSKEISSSSILENFTISTYKDTKPVEVFEDDSIKSSVGEKRDRSKDDAVFRAPKPRVKEPNLSRTSSFSLESNLNGPLMKRSVSYVSLLAANMPRNSQPYRAHLQRQHSNASQDLWPRLRKTSSEVNIDNKDGTLKETSLWRDDHLELQSVQVLRNILSQSQASLVSPTDEPDDVAHLQQRDPPTSDKRLEDSSDKDAENMKWGRSQSEETSSSITWIPKNKMVHSASLDQENSNSITRVQRRQPSINLSTWSERPKSQISIKSDGDYTSGFGKKSVGQDEIALGINKNKEVSFSKNVMYSTSNTVHVEVTSKHERFVADGRSKSISDLSRIPVVRAVELKKPFTSQTFDRPPLKPVQPSESLPDNKEQPDDFINNNDESFVGVNSLAKRFGVPQKRPVSVHVSSHSKVSDLQTDIKEYSKTFKSTDIGSENKFSNVSPGGTMDGSAFSLNSKHQESQIKVSELYNQFDLSTSAIKAQAKIRSGGFVESEPVPSYFEGMNQQDKNSTALYNRAPKDDVSLPSTISNTVQTRSIVSIKDDSKSSVVSNVSVPPSPTLVNATTKQSQSLDRKVRPLNLQPVVKGFRVPPETMKSPSPKELTSPSPKTKEFANPPNNTLINSNSNIPSYKKPYQRAFSTPSITSNPSTNIKEIAKEKTTIEVRSVPSSPKIVTPTAPVPPPPPPELPFLKPVGERKNIKLLPPPEAKPRDLLMQSIRSFGIDSLKKVSK